MAETDLYLRVVLLDVYVKCENSVICMNAHIGDINTIFNKSIPDVIPSEKSPEDFVGKIFDCGLNEGEKSKLIRILQY